MDIIHLNSEWIVKSTCKCNIHHAQLTFKTQISDGHISMECTWATRNIYYCTILVLFVFMSVYTLIFFYMLVTKCRFTFGTLYYFYSYFIWYSIYIMIFHLELSNADKLFPPGLVQWMWLLCVVSATVGI